MGQIFGGRYELVDLLATGGAGAVWRVWDRRDQAYRAGKVLQQGDSTSLLRFVRETNWRIDHPHIVAPLSWSGEDGRIIFTMPLVRGGSLATLLGDYGRLPLGWTLEVTEQLLGALAEVHGHGLVHRDVKPGNVLLEPSADGHPDINLGDFGIAAPVGEPRLTRLTDVVGTPGYLSPEARAGADPDPRQDVYAVGALVIELLTGARPNGEARVPAQWAGTQLGAWLERLVGPVDGRPSAAQAREQLMALDVWGTLDPEPIEVFDQVPDLPAGWGAHGPVRRRASRPGAPTSAASAPPLGEAPVQAVPRLVEPARATNPLAELVSQFGLPAVLMVAAGVVLAIAALVVL